VGWGGGILVLKERDKSEVGKNYIMKNLKVLTHLQTF
jgi:hypothetical protein